jgi:hypothetical protein
MSTYNEEFMQMQEKALKWQHDEKMQQLEQFREVQRLIFIVDQR